MKNAVTAKSYVIMERAVEEGIEFGWNRAYKHTESPEPELIREKIAQEVMNAICDVFDFGDDGEE